MSARKKLVYVGNRLLKHGLSPTTADTLPSLFRKEGYEVKAVSDKKNKIFRMFDMLRAIIQNKKWADLVIIDTYSTTNFYYAIIVAFFCRKFKIPYIPFLHGGSLPARLEKSKKQCEVLFGNAYKNVAPSAYLYEAFKEKNIPNLIYIPNTIPLENYSFKKRERVTYRLLWVRSFASIYNPEMALQVVEKLQKEGKDVTLCMVGPDKGSMENCEKIAKDKGLPVTFTGLLDKKAWHKLSEEYDIFINTTNFDNTPISVIEAMALGLPVVSTDVGGLPFLIENAVTGILTPAKDAQTMADAITALVQNPDKMQHIANQARRQVEEFDWEVAKYKWNELLD